MKAPEDVLILTELLDRQVVHALRQKGTRLLLTVPPLLDFIANEPRLAGIVEDLLRDTEEHWKRYESVCDEVLAQMRAIWPACHSALLPKRQADKTDSCHWDDEGFDRFDERLNREPESDREYSDEPPKRITKLRFWASHWVACGRDPETNTYLDPVLAEGARTLRELEEKLDQAWIRLRLHLESGGGVAFVELRGLAQELVPGLTGGDDGLLVAARNMRTKKLWEEINKQSLFQDMVKGNVYVGQYAVFIQRLHLALETGLARGRSRSAIVRRYAAKCEAFDKERLVELIARSPGKVEAALTVDFARYLFDVGFNPIVNPEIAGLRPDVLDPRVQSAVYVEAKQYSDAETAEIRKNVAQVFDTWARLANNYNVPEAFLLVFRVGGRMLQLPDALTANGRKLNLHVVDLAPPSETGSRATKPPLVLTETDLLPPI